MKALFLLSVIALCITWVYGGIFDCPSKMSEAYSTCKEILKTRLNIDETVAEQTNEETPSSFKCCYYAEFAYCMKSKTKDDCGDNISTAMQKVLSGTAKVLSSKCEGYDYPSATCIFFVWFWFIIGAIIVFFLISIGCCLARCLCGRK